MVSLSLLFTGCSLFGGGDDSGLMMGGPQCEVNDEINGAPGAGPASAPITADGLHIFINGAFRIDDAGNVGSLDFESIDGNTLQGLRLDIVPWADPPNIAQNGCTVIIPITPDNTTTVQSQGSEVWRAELRARPRDMFTNCTDPAYATIQQYAGDLVVALADTAVLTIGPQTPDATDFIASMRGEYIRDYVLGGTVQLRSDFPMSEMAVLVRTTDECGVVTSDSEDVLAADVLSNNGPVAGFYEYVGFGLVQFTVTQP